MRSTKPLPFGFNPKVEHRNARLRRLIRKGILKPMTKAQARKVCDQAAAQAGDTQNSSSLRHER